VSGKRVLAGFHAVTARLRHAPESIEAMYVDAGRRDGRMQQLLDRAEAAGVRVTAADATRLQRLAGGVAHQGVVALCREQAKARSLDDLLAQVNSGTLLLLLDGVTDPRNLGACMRTAEAAGAQAVLVPRDRSASLTPVVTAAAAGAAETLPLVAVTNLARAMDEIRDAGVWIAGAAAEAQRTIYEVDSVRPLAWALGAEGAGLRRLTREKCDWLARIPLAGRTDCLNVSVAAGVCLFETLRQRAAKAAAADRSSP
jgi:23S rRNA (guanosine2251-2'-O)-methyltransferase